MIELACKCITLCEQDILKRRAIRLMMPFTADRFDSAVAKALMLTKSHNNFSNLT
jgi:hypothetical protein